MRKLHRVVWTSLVTITLTAPLFAGGQAKPRTSANNLKELALAMHDYYGANKRFAPAAVYDKDGKALLSWRVLLLPYLGQNALYKHFRLNEPWNSPHNKKLLAKMPAVFAGPKGKKGPFTTPYQGVVGKGTVFDGPHGIKLLDIRDGATITILFVEARNAVPWTKPADVQFVDGKGMPKLGGQFAGGFHAAFCCGTVRFVAEKTRASILRALFLRADGTAVSPADLSSRAHR